MSQRTFRVLFLITLVLVTIVSLTPKDVMPPSAGPDKLQHVVAYLALGMLGGRGYQGLRSVLLLAVGLMAFGGVLELAQTFVSGRSASIADALANGLGIVFGLAVSRAPDLLKKGSSARKP